MIRETSTPVILSPVFASESLARVLDRLHFSDEIARRHRAVLAVWAGQAPMAPCKRSGSHAAKAAKESLPLRGQLAATAARAGRVLLVDAHLERPAAAFRGDPAVRHGRGRVQRRNQRITTGSIARGEPVGFISGHDKGE